jgi:hypothetical protein
VMNTPKWYDNAIRELEEDLDSGRITTKEFTQAMRELSRELDDEDARYRARWDND